MSLPLTVAPSQGSQSHRLRGPRGRHGARGRARSRGRILYYLCIDADGLDPAITPTVAAPVPGGLVLHQIRELIHGLTAKGRVLGMDVVEVAPARDANGISCMTAGRLVLNLIGAAARAEYFKGD